MNESVSQFIMAIVVVGVIIVAILTIAAGNNPASVTVDGASKPATFNSVESEPITESINGNDSGVLGYQHPTSDYQWPACSLSVGYMKPC